MSNLVKVQKKTSYSILCGNTYLSFNNVYRFPYPQAEELMTDYVNKLYKNMDKETNDKKKEEIQYLIESIKIVIYTEH